MDSSTKCLIYLFICIAILGSTFFIVRHNANKSEINNSILLTNNVKDKDPVYIDCKPYFVHCPHSIRPDEEVEYSNVTQITIVHKHLIYIIDFSPSGEFRLFIDDILKEDIPKRVKGQCEKIEKYSTHQIIDCNKLG